MTSAKTQATTPRLKSAFFEKGVNILSERIGAKNINAVPRLEKIVVNIGVSAARENIKALDVAGEELGQITGQKASVRKSKKSISAFKLRCPFFKLLQSLCKLLLLSNCR